MYKYIAKIQQTPDNSKYDINKSGVSQNKKTGDSIVGCAVAVFLCLDYAVCFVELFA